MRSHREIIDDAGAETVSASLGLSINTTRSWRRRDSIPDGFWLTFANRKWATLNELAEYASAKTRPESAAA